jgi:hypothetical protein
MSLNGYEEDDASNEVGIEEIQIGLENYAGKSNANNKGEDFKRIN